MNNQQAIMDLQEYIGNGEYNGDNPPIYLSTAMAAIGALEMQERRQWIPCSERLPKEEEYILLSFKNYTGLDIGRYEKDGESGNFYPGDEEESYASYGLVVNAWMPLPEPYKEELRQ